MTMKIHVVTDTRTGISTIRGKSGRTYSMAEYERAREGSDDEAKAIRDDIDLASQTDVDWRQSLQHEIDNCPQCQAAKARGEHPQFRSGADLQALLDAIPPRERMRLERLARPKKLRWRQQRRRA